MERVRELWRQLRATGRKGALIGCGGLLTICVVGTLIGAALGGNDGGDGSTATATHAAATAPATQPATAPPVVTSTAAPQPTTTTPPAPAATTAGQPTPAATQNTVAFVEVNGARPGETASVVVQTQPNTTCTLSYTTPAGTASEAEGLGDATANVGGVARWEWQIGASTSPGQGTVRVTCGDAHAASAITIAP